MSSAMKSWIEFFSGFEHSEGDMEELTHHGADDQLGGLAREFSSWSSNCLPQAVLYKVTMAGM